MEISKEQFDAFVNSVFYYKSLVDEYRLDVEILDAQVIAIGNLLIKKGLMTKDEIKNYVRGVMEMKRAEKKRERGYFGNGVTKSELEELLSTGNFNFNPPLKDKK